MQLFVSHQLICLYVQRQQQPVTTAARQINKFMQHAADCRFLSDKIKKTARRQWP